MSVHSIKNNTLRVKVNSLGAELCSVISQETNIEYIWQAEPSVWARHAPHLFPVVGRLKNGSYSFKSHDYQLPQHGFARDQEFKCLEETDHRLVFELAHTEETLKSFPFPFHLKISFTLSNNRLKVEYTVFNPASSDLYFSIGAHPAFNCPLEAQEHFEDYKLVIPGQNQLSIHTLHNGLLSDVTKTLPLQADSLRVSRHLFDQDALVMLGTQIENISLVSSKTRHGVTLTCRNWPYFGIWTKPLTEKFICLEPWFGVTDTDTANGNLVEKEGILMVEPKAEFDCFYDLAFF